MPNAFQPNAFQLGAFQIGTPTVSTEILELPVDFYMEGLPQYRDLGRTVEHMKGAAREEVTLKAGARGRLSKATPGFVATTDKRGYN